MSRREVKLPSALIYEARPNDLTRFEEVIREADFRKRRSQNTWLLRNDAGTEKPLVRIVPLQREDGYFTKDATRWLTETPDLISIEEARGIVGKLNEALTELHIANRGPQHEIELRLLRELDPLPTLKGLVSAQPHIRLYRVLPTDKLKKREGLWRIVSAATEHNESWSQMTDKGRLPEDIFGGVLATQWPAIFISTPLVARNQPLAMAFRTAQGAQVIAITDKNFVRFTSLGGWPVGGGVTSLGGSGKGIYASSISSFPEGFSESLLADSVRGANGFLERLTDVTQWADSKGNINHVERNIAWSSALFGFEAIMELAREWNTSETLWTAFRALTMLEGLWPNPNNRLLPQLLNPENVINLAVSTFPNPVHREWATDVANNYRKQVQALHPSGDLKQCIDVLRHVRNLVHGTGFRPGERRAERLEALRAVKDAEIQLIKDIAVFWWSSVLFSPETHAPPNADPFAG